MCPEYDIYHTRLRQEDGGFLSKQKAPFLPLSGLQVSVDTRKDRFSFREHIFLVFPNLHFLCILLGSLIVVYINNQSVREM